MSQHEEYTSPPGFRVSGGNGAKLAPVLIDPAASASEGDVITRVGAGYAPQGGSGVLTVSGQLTDAQIKALPNYPTGYVELVPVPGAAKLLSFHRAYLLVDIRGGNYTNITDSLDLTNSGLTISYGNDASQASMVARAQMFGAGGLVGVHLLPYVNTDATRDPKVQAYHQAGDPLPFANLPLKLVGYNADGPFTGGHADNTLSWKIWYSLDDAVPFGA
jgi:hypothetical protein